MNPLSWLTLLVTFLVLVFRSFSAAQVVWLVVALTATLHFQRVPVPSVWVRVRPLFVFLPVMFAFYLFFSLILSAATFRGVVETVAISSGRILLMVLGVATFLEVTRPMAILDSVRTLWRRAGIRFRPVEDFFQLLYLSLRFFPMLREEVLSIWNMKRALGLPTAGTRLSRVRQVAACLPGLISNSLHRADNLAIAMETRGYGSVLPRGVAHPLGFRLADAALAAFLTILIGGHMALAQL